MHNFVEFNIFGVLGVEVCEMVGESIRAETVLLHQVECYAQSKRSSGRAVSDYRYKQHYFKISVDIKFPKGMCQNSISEQIGLQDDNLTGKIRLGHNTQATSRGVCDPYSKLYLNTKHLIDMKIYFEERWFKHSLIVIC